MTKTTVMRIYLVAVMLVLCFVAYDAFTTPVPTRRPDAQTILNARVPHALPGPPPTAAPVANDEALTIMRIPRFGNNWQWTALEGVSLDVLDSGPGHYPNTELPGEEGNSVFAAHRASHGDPFIDFDTFKVGDEIVLSQVGAEWTYTITEEPVIISPNAKWVLEDFANGEWLTLTTCWPKYGSEKRMYVRAELSSAESLTSE